MDTDVPLGPDAERTSDKGSDEEYEEFIEEVEEEVEVDEESWSTGSSGDQSEESKEEVENLLSFTTFPIDVISGHHIMVVAAFKRFVVVGTNRGVVALIEATTGTVFRLLNNHVDPISDVSCDLDEEFVGSSDKAGVLTVQNLYDENGTYRKEFDTPMQSVALHPRYSRNEDRPLVVGGGDRVVLVQRVKFLGHRKATVLQERRGKVYVVRWCGTDIIAWANDRGVQLYSYAGGAMVQLVTRPADSPRPELYRCSLVWEPPRTLLCGWGDWVQQLQIHELRMDERLRWGTEFMSRTHRVDVLPAFRTGTAPDPYRICGLAPFGSDRFLLLVCLIEQEGYVQDLEVRIVERSTFADVFRGRLHSKFRHSLQFTLAFSAGTGNLRSPSSQAGGVLGVGESGSTTQSQGATHTLGTSRSELEECAYYIVCVDSIIKATPCDDDDHVDYLLGIGRVEEAYDFACVGQLHRHTLVELGKEVLQHLFAHQRYDEAASRLPVILESGNSGEWEKWIYQFDQSNVSDLLLDVLPAPALTDSKSRKDNSNGNESNGGRIGEEYYGLVLIRCLEKDVLCLKAAVHRLKGLFNCAALCRAVELRYSEWRQCGAVWRAANGVSEEQFRAVGDTYGLLLCLSKRYDEALHVLLQVDKSDELFNFIREKQVFAKANEVLPELFAKNETETIRLLLEHVNSENDSEAPMSADFAPLACGSVAELSTEAVVRRLEKTQRRYLWSYLKAVRAHDRAAHAAVSRTRAQLIAALFIEYEPTGLLAFLRENATHIPNLKEIYALCRKHQLLEETIYLLGRMGKEEEGLRIIVQDMKNMKKAIQFIADISSEEEQNELYCKLVHMALEVNAGLPSCRGQKYVEHRVVVGDTWASIENKYGLEKGTLQTIDIYSDFTSKIKNNSDENFDKDRGEPLLAGTVCAVPLNLMEALLAAVVDPSVSGRLALDPAYVVKRLPEDEPMPNVGNCIAAVARSKADDMRLMATVVQVTMIDIGQQYNTLYKRRAAALSVDPASSFCFFCRQSVMAIDVVVFECSHVYHASCVVDFMADKDTLRVDPANLDVTRFFEKVEALVKPGMLPHCFICKQESGVFK